VVTRGEFGADASSDAEKTLSWGGIAIVRNNFGEEVTDYTVTARSGTNYRDAIVPLAISSAVSRKAHGSSGAFDLPPPLSGRPGVECRSGPVHGDHVIVFTFTQPLASGMASVISGVGQVAGMPVLNGHEMTVYLTGVTDAQQLQLKLSGLATANNAQLMPDTVLPISFLLGDTNRDGMVNSGDVLQTRNRSGEAITNENCASDMNLTGILESGDAFIVRQRAGRSLP
jgi:hypothetical protein